MRAAVGVKELDMTAGAEAVRPAAPTDVDDGVPVGTVKYMPKQVSKMDTGSLWPSAQSYSMGEEWNEWGESN